MSDEAAKAAAKAAKKEAKKAAKKAAKQSSEAGAPTTETSPAEPAPAPTEPQTQPAPEKSSKKRKKSNKNEDDADATDAKAAKKQRKAERKAAKAQSAQDAPAKSAAANDAAPSITAPAASSSDVQQFLKDNAITFDPVDAHKTYLPLLEFSQLPVDESLKQGLANFKKPTPIQSASWPILLHGKDCVAIAETGSGKTVAFGLPAVKFIQSLPTPKKKSKAPVSVLVLAPTRELAMQTHDNLQLLADPLGLKSLCVYGGVPKPPQVDALKQGPRIVVGTPGRILDLCNDEALDLSQVSYLVLDEADRMLDKGFENDIRNIIGKCNATLDSSTGHKSRQTAMFSATWPLSVRKLAGDFMADPVRITVGSDELTASTSVEQHVTVLDNGRMKDGALTKTLNENKIPRQVKGKATGKDREKVLVFALYKKECTRVSQFLERQGYQVSCIQGDMGQAQRTQSLQDFKDGKTGILVATDVAARGLDIPKVELVINYTFPLTIEDYIHRIGRTGRAGRKGKSQTFFTEDDKSHAGELQRVLKDANQAVPEALVAFGGTIKKKSHATYGDFYREDLAGLKSTKITFDE